MQDYVWKFRKLFNRNTQALQHPRHEDQRMIITSTHEKDFGLRRELRNELLKDGDMQRP